MTAPPELDELVAMVLTQPAAPPTPVHELVGRWQRRRRQRRIRVCALSTATAVALIAAVVAISRPSGGGGLQVATRPPTTIAAAAPRSLAVTCADTAIRVSTKVVQAQPDGVHLSISFTERGGGDFGYTTFNPFSGGGGAGDGFLAPGPWAEVDPLAPGRNVLRCAQPDTEGSSRMQTVEVVDPHHYWTPIADPQCTLVPVQATAMASSASGAVQSWLETKGHASDQVRVLGYPRDVHPTLGVTHHGEVVARVAVDQMGGPARPWSITGEACATL